MKSNGKKFHNNAMKVCDIIREGFQGDCWRQICFIGVKRLASQVSCFLDVQDSDGRIFRIEVLDITDMDLVESVLKPKKK